MFWSGNKNIREAWGSEALPPGNPGAISVEMGVLAFEDLAEVGDVDLVLRLARGRIMGGRWLASGSGGADT